MTLPSSGERDTHAKDKHEERVRTENQLGEAAAKVTAEKAEERAGKLGREPGRQPGGRSSPGAGTSAPGTGGIGGSNLPPTRK